MSEPAQLICGRNTGGPHGCGLPFPARFPTQKVGFCKECLARKRAESRRDTPRIPELMDRLPGWLKVVNCSRCRRLLVVPGQGWGEPEPEPVAARVYGRPVCRRCVDAARRAGLPPENSFAIPPREE